MDKKPESPKITDSKKVWVAWTNTDLTEGRGRAIPKAVCQIEATAIRLGEKGSVMGSDCNITESVAVLVEGIWLVPGEIKSPNSGDLKEQDRLNEFRRAIEKAASAGLSNEDILALCGAGRHDFPKS